MIEIKTTFLFQVNLQNNDQISYFWNSFTWEKYSTHYQGKSVAPESFIKTIKNKICKCMSSASKIYIIDKLADIVNQCNNTYSTIKMKIAEVKSSTLLVTN